MKTVTLITTNWLLKCYDNLKNFLNVDQVNIMKVKYLVYYLFIYWLIDAKHFNDTENSYYRVNKSFDLKNVHFVSS